ncbi:unnamed protein product [Closterium sp. NIES-53]
MAVGALFKDYNGRINSMDFHRTEDLLVTASDDESIRVYDTSNATLVKTIHSRKYGVDQVVFTHHPSAVLYSSKNGWDESLRYLSLYDNRYLRYFKGHRDKVVSLCMSPKNDSFLSGALDHTVRLWDLRTCECQGLMRVRGRPAVAFDQQGLVFAVAMGGGAVKLFDARSYEKGPFDTMLVGGDEDEVTSIKFSNDGNQILVCTLNGRIYLLDAFEGQKLHTLCVVPDIDGAPLEASFSPDAKYVVSGSGDGTVKAWSATTGAQVATWGNHAGVPSVVKWAPRRLMFATASVLLALWIPDLSKIPPGHEKTLFFFTIGDFSEGNSRLPPLTRTLEFLVTELIFTPDSTSIFSFASALHGFLANLEELPGQRHSDASREARRVRGGGAGRDFSSHVNSSSWATVHRCCASTSSSAASRMRQRALSTHPGSHANAASAQPHRQPLLRQMRQIARLGAAKLARRVCLEASLAENTHLSYAPQSPPQSSHEPSEAVESDTDRKTSDARASLDHVDCFMRPLSHRAILSLIELCDELRELELSNPVSKISEAPGTSKAGIEQPRAKGSKTLSWLLLNETPCAIPLDAAPATVLLLGVDRLRRHGAPQSMSSPDSTKSVQAGVASATDAKTSRDRVKEEGGTLESIEE